MYRLFVAIAVPDPARAQLVSLCSGLDGARWVAPEYLHVTLRFIGEVDGGRAEDVHDALSRIRAPNFDLTLGGVDCFAQAGKVHTLWTGVEKEPLLSHLRDKVESAVVRAGLPAERRKFRPHVTLARLKGAPERLGGYLQRHNRFRTDPVAVDAFTLFRSHLTPKGPHYEALEEYVLEKGRRPQPPLTGGAPASATGS
jgi:2'-5' RNA ligase